MAHAQSRSATLMRKPTRTDHQKRQTWYLIDPRTSRWLPFWDVIAAVALFYTASVTPYEVSFLDTPSPVGLVIANRVIDAVFLLDMLSNFFLMFPSDDRQSSMGAHWVEHHGTIVRHYLFGWFAIDLIAAATSIVDLANELIESKDEAARRAKLKMLRGLRVLRLFKMLRLLRGMRLMQRWETRLTIDYGMLSLAQSMILVMIFAHWAACVWMLQIALRDHLEDTWLWAFGYCIDTALASPSATSGMSGKELRDLSKYSMAYRPQGFEGEYACLPPSSVYSASLYWSVMTITSVGCEFAWLS